MSKLNIKINDTDFTNKAYLFENDNIETIVTIIDVSFKKTLQQIYIDLQTFNVGSNTIQAQTWKNDSWANIESLDETQGLRRSGFIFVNEDLQKKGDEFVLRLVIATTPLLKIRGIGMQFCNEQDLRQVVPGVVRFFPRDYNSHISAIETATRNIVQKVRNSGRFKYNNRKVTEIDRYDFLNIEQVRFCTAYLALYYIYLNLQDTVNDNYSEKAKEFLKLFESNFKVFISSNLAIDYDDDGKENHAEEVESVKRSGWYR